MTLLEYIAQEECKNITIKNLVLICQKNEHNICVCDFLNIHHIGAVIVDNIADFRAELSLCSPAFLLFDFGIKGNKALFSELPINALRPLPFIIIADTFLNGVSGPLCSGMVQMPAWKHL